MSSNFYKDLLDPSIENSSDVSEIGPDDLENIVKGVDDIDDALFGFKPKQQDSQKKAESKPSVEPKSLERSKTAINKQSNVLDLPEGDLLADISLSDDDFYDLGKKSPSASTKRDKLDTTPKIQSQDKLIKSKKIASLFGLDDEDDVITENKKKQEGAADWLGIKDSPLKTAAKPATKDNSELQTANTGLPDGSKFQNEVKTNLPDVKVTPLKISDSKDTDIITVAAKKSQSEVKSSESIKTKSVKSGDNLFDLLDDKYEQPKSIENAKEKKSAIFDELFGDSSFTQKSKSRRNSAVKTPDTSNNEPSGISTIPRPVTTEESSATLGQYIPSAATSKRPGLGRRRETTPALLTTQSSISLFQDDFLVPSERQQEIKKEATPAKSDTRTSTAEMHESLPSWLGGSGIKPDSKLESKPSVVVDDKQTPQQKPLEMSHPVSLTQPVKTTIETGKPVVAHPDVQTVEKVREALAINSEQTQQTTLALQRTETQLLSALQLQTTQSSLSAVCARQRSLLDNQEKQLSQLVARQTDRQTQLEKQMQQQQLRIQQLLEVLAENFAAPQVDFFPPKEATGNPATENEDQRDEIVKDLEREIHKANFQNEELRLRMELMEKHYKMEYESLQVQHRREIESWEEKLAMQKELSDQLCEDYKERIKRLKENQEELLAQHNERVQRLREEKAEDIRQLMEFHKTTLEQMMVISKMIPPGIREEQKTSFQTWKPLEPSQLSEKEEDLLKKENMLKVLQEKLELQKLMLEKKAEEIEDKEEQEKMKREEILRQLKHEKNQLKYQQQQLNQEKKHMEEQYHKQRKQLEEMQETFVSEQTQLATENLKLAEEKAKIDALAKLQGVSGTATFDVLKSKAEVHGALEAARNAELQAIEERKKLREKERLLDSERWRLKEMEEDLLAKAEHLDRLMQVSEANQKAGQKALDEAKQLEKRAEEKLQEVERRKMELREKEKNLIKIKLDIAQEEIRLNRKREQLEHILPPLSSDEAVSLQPIKDFIDPKMLIMRLRAERESEAISKPQPPGKESSQC